MRTCIFSSAVLLAGSALHAATGLTIYNSDLAVIRESVPLDLKAGETAASFDHATAQVMPDSVVLRDPARKSAFSILEQGYRNDPVSQGLLLSHFEGQSIDFRIDYPDGKSEVKPGKIVRSGYVPGGEPQDPIIEMDGKLRFELPGKPLFPALGDDSILRPTLSWRLGSEAAEKFDAQLSYLSHGFTWEATYNVVAPEDSDTVSLSGWVTVGNHSGTSFQDAEVKLVAGEVHVVATDATNIVTAGLRSGSGAITRNNIDAVLERPFDDFHLYTLGRPLTLRDEETKQVEFKRAPQAKAVKRYIYDPTSGEGGPKQVASYWEFRNDEASGLGIPLPAGKVRFYRADAQDGNLEFVGENKIEHTPKNEKLSLLTGYAFDLTGERKVTDATRNGRQKTMDETIEVTLKNHSKTPKDIVIREHPGDRGENWQVTKNSDPFEKIDAGRIEFTVTLAPDQEKKVTYSVHHHW